MFSITSKFPILLVICFLLVHFSYADDLKVETGGRSDVNWSI